ncbi:MAG: DMT family transporter [Christensenellales bacterium]
MENRVKGPVLIAATAILWSLGGLLIKLIPWDAMTIVGMRAFIAALVMIVYMKKVRITLSPAVILGGLCMSATTILFVFANKLTTAANAIVLQYTAPVFVVIFSVLFLKKRLKALDVLAVLIVFAGIALFFFDRLQEGAMLGNTLAALAGVTFSGVFMVNKMPGAKPEESVLLGHLINTVAALPFIAAHLTFEPVAWLSIAILGIFQLGIAYVLFSIGIKHTPPITASLIAALEPLLNPVWVLLATGETPGVFALFGGAVVLVTIVLYNVIVSRRGELP